MTDCQTCSKGEEFVAQHIPCIGCASGKFQNHDQLPAVKCKFCPAGFQFVDMYSLCKTCFVGMYQEESTAFAVRCKVCEAGRYENEVGSKEWTSAIPAGVLDLSCPAGEGSAGLCGEEILDSEANAGDEYIPQRSRYTASDGTVVESSTASTSYSLANLFDGSTSSTLGTDDHIDTLSRGAGFEVDQLPGLCVRGGGVGGHQGTGMLWLGSTPHPELATASDKAKCLSLCQKSSPSYTGCEMLADVPFPKNEVDWFGPISVIDPTGARRRLLSYRRGLNTHGFNNRTSSKYNRTSSKYNMTQAFAANASFTFSNSSISPS